MAEQIGLFDPQGDPWQRAPILQGRPANDREAAWRRFHAENPHVARELAKMALDLRRGGMQRWGMKGLFEVLRWRNAMKTSRPEGEWKLNNNYTALYARLLMEVEPVLTGFFELRKTDD